jgi:hypothetical protein
MLVDGSIIGEVPVKAALGLPVASRILAVYLGRGIEALSVYGSSADVLARTSSLLHTELVREQLRHAPELVTVPLGGLGWLDFRRCSETAEVAYALTCEHLAKR